MQSTDVNYKAINDVYKNAHIALLSISDLLPSVTDADLKAELQAQYEGYEKIVGEISSYMAENGMQPQDIGTVQKVMMRGSIKMKTVIDDSRNNIAEMMIKGTVNGITELAAMQNERQNFQEKTADFIDRLLSLEEKYEQNLKKFL